MNNLLVLTSRFPHEGDSTSGVFVHAQVSSLKKYFKRVVVVCIIPNIPKSLSKTYGSRRENDYLAKDYSFDNVDVVFSRYSLIPTKNSKLNRGKNALKPVLKSLKELNFIPDIIHSHFIWPTGHLALELKKEFKVPSILTAHGFDVYDVPFRDDEHNRLVKSILKKADHIITVSDKNKDILVNKLSQASDKISLIFNGYDDELFYPAINEDTKKELELDSKMKFILSIGNTQYIQIDKNKVDVKGHRYLYEAAKIVVKKNPKVHFGIIGSVQNSDLKIDDSMIDNFTLLGPKPHKKIPLWVNSCDLFVIPSLNEGNPTVLFEAIGCGKPIVASNVGGIPDIIEDDNIGILVPPGDSKALADAILNSLDKTWNEDYIYDFSKQFTWDNIAKQLIDIYNSALKNNI